MLTLEDLSTNRLTTPTINPATSVKNQKPGTPSVLPSDNPSINKPSNKKGRNNKQPKQQCVNTDPSPGKRVTRTKRCINYGDLNLGIDSNDNSSLPRKCKQSKAVALCEPSQTVIAARNQRVTQKSLQKSEYEQTKLIGTVIITPPAKEIKEENDSKKIKTEQDWLKLPNNDPKENISIDDPNVCPRLIHKDGTICHSKTYWASIKRKPPLKEFELLDLSSYNEELETGKLTNNIGPEALNSSDAIDTCTDKGMSHEENKGVVVNTVKSSTKTPVTSDSAVNDTPSKEPTSTDIPPINN